MNAAERALIGQGSSPTPTQTRGAVPWRRIFASRDLWCLSGAYAVLGYNVYFYLAWFYLYLVNERGFSLEAGERLGLGTWAFVFAYFKLFAVLGVFAAFLRASQRVTVSQR